MKNEGNIELWIQYKRNKAILTYTSRYAQNEAWRIYTYTISREISSSELWRKVKILNSTKTFSTIIIKENDNYIHDPIEVANKLAVEFTNRGKLPHSFEKNLPELPTLTNLDTSDLNSDFTQKEIKRCIEMGSSTTPGPDQIPLQMFKNLNQNQTLQLLQILNYFWQNSIPQQWKVSHVIPIYKSNKPPSLTSSYRPISLTNSLCKIMERIVNIRLKRYLERNSLIDSNQYGFRSGFSSLDGIVNLESDIRKAHQQNKATLTVFIDLKEAFDSINHKALLTKLQSLNLNGNILNFIQSFLSNRYIHVKYQNQLSNPQKLTQGLPQGSVISPTLFTIMINDLTYNKNTNIHYSKFADDIAIWTSQNKTTECLDLIQIGLNHLSHWTKQWGLTISTAKTKAIFFTRKKIPDTNLTINQVPIEFVSNHKFLGMTFDKYLTWKPHLTNLKERTNKDLNLMKIISNNSWGADYTSLRNIYKSLILSKIEYGSLIYDTAAKTNLKSINTIQNHAARIILGCLRNTKTDHLEILANLIPLHISRKLLLTKYAIRTISNPTNPISEQILENLESSMANISSKPRTTIQRIQHEFHSLPIKPNGIAKIQPFMKLNTYNQLAKTEMHVQNKENLDNRTWQKLHDEMVEKYQDYLKIYTDGSVQEEKGACGVWCEQFSFVARLPDHSSILTCELYAIFITLRYLPKIQQKALILTDSLSAAKSLNSPHHSKHHLVIQIADLIDRLQQEVVIQWIPSHTGIKGNDKADELAKKSLSLQTISNVPYSTIDAKRIIQHHYNKQYLKNCIPCPHETNISFSYSNKTPKILLTPRHHQTILSRLHLRVTKITHLHILTKTDPKICPTCQIVITLQHLLIDCPLYSNPRQNLIAHLSSQNKTFTLDNLLNLSMPHEILIKFITDTGLIKSI